MLVAERTHTYEHKHECHVTSHHYMSDPTSWPFKYACGSAITGLVAGGALGGLTAVSWWDQPSLASTTVPLGATVGAVAAGVTGYMTASYLQDSIETSFASTAFGSLGGMLVGGVLGTTAGLLTGCYAEKSNFVKMILSMTPTAARFTVAGAAIGATIGGFTGLTIALTW